MPAKVFTSNLTSYDLVKALAIVLTVIDHVGYYFYPEHEILRIVGRACVPIWCFLIGYANTRELSKDMAVWAVVLLGANVVTGAPLLPANILVTFLLIRLSIDKLAGLMVMRGWEPLVYTTVLMIALSIPSAFLFEYGTLAFLLALSGFIVRHSEQIPIGNAGQKFYMICVIAVFVLIQSMMFGFSEEGIRLCAMAVGATALLMAFFRPLEFQTAHNRMTAWAVLPLQLLGRYTLEIYAIHLLIFKAIAAYYGFANHGFFEFKLFQM